MSRKIASSYSYTPIAITLTNAHNSFRAAMMMVKIAYAVWHSLKVGWDLDETDEQVT